MLVVLKVHQIPVTTSLLLVLQEVVKEAVVEAVVDS
jgi:hypothetical protein